MSRETDIRRRDLITLIGGAAAMWPLTARVEQRTRRIGLLANLPLPPIKRFRRKLAELGYVEGRNLIIKYRFEEGRNDGFRAQRSRGEVNFEIRLLKI